MKTQIFTCDKCGMTLLDGTSTCHACGHVPTDQPPVRAEIRKAAPSLIAQDDEEHCSKCGELCRVGLVRCWKCGAFMRPEIEAAYLRKRSASQYKIEHVELKVIEASEITEADTIQRRVTTPDEYLSSRSAQQNYTDGSDDFELTGSVLGDDEEDTFDLGQNMQLSDGIDDDAQLMDSTSFQLQGAVSETEPVPELPSLDMPPVRDAAVEPKSAEPAATATETSEAKPASVSKPEAAKDAPEQEDLLRIAAEEEKDIQRVRMSLRSKDTFLVYCPMGCRIRVKEKHRGMKGKCPRCQSEFTVPKKPIPKPTDVEAAPVLVSKYKKWITDVRLHIVDPLKLRIKADSLLNECQQVDVGFAEDGLLIATLVAGKFGANAKKIPPVRQAMLDHFLKQGTVETLTAAAKAFYSKEVLAQLNVAQPTPAGTESLFHDIPVFGVNRIAVRIPKLPDDTNPKYLSFNLSEFRAFAEAMQSVCGIEGLGANSTIPMTDVYSKHKCKISEVPVQELANVNYYEKDPGFKLEVSGYRCSVCGIVVSEAARAEKKLGGANGKGIAKAKCPGCTKPMGNKPLYQLVKPAEEPTAETPTAPAK